MTKTILYEDSFDGGWHTEDWGRLPDGWDAWWFDNHDRPSDQGWLEHRPEYGFPDPNHANAHRQILSPPHSLQYGKLWATVWAGVTRVYTVPVGKMIEIGLMGYVLGGGQESDNPERPGKMWDMVGIDPAVDFDGRSPSIVWGEPLENLVRGFDSDPNWMLYTARAKSVTGQVSVFTHFHPQWPIQHLGPLFDNFYLAVIDDDDPPPGDGIDRTVWLMNPLADASNSCAVVNGQWPYRRAMQGGSADEVRIGIKDDLVKHNRCFIMNGDEWPGDIDEYIGPETEKIHIAYKNNFQLEGRVLAHSLVDIGVGLLFPSTNKQEHITDEFGGARVASGGRIIYHNGLDIRSSWGSWKDLIIASLPGKVLVAGINPSEPWFGQQVRTATPLPNDETLFIRYAHLVDGDEYVRVDNVVEEGQTIGKPDNTGQSTADHLHIDIAVQGKSGVKYADPEILIEWSGNTDPPPVDPPVDPPPIDPPPSGPRPEYLAPHLQTRHDQEALEVFLVAKHPRGIKLFHAQDCVWAHDFMALRGEEIWTNYRKHFPEQDLSSSPERIVKHICDSYEGDIRLFGDKITSIEPYNETMNSDPEVVKRIVQIELAFIAEVERREWPVKCLVHNTGVGNPHESQVGLMLPLAEAVARGGHAMGLHCYGGADRNQSYLVTDFDYHGGRWRKQDEVWANYGYYVKWFLSEAGPIGAGPRDPTSNYLPLWFNRGWKHKDCMNGDWLRCYDFLEMYGDMLHQWNLKHDMRLIAYALFTSGGPEVGWEYFKIGGPEWLYLASH